MRSESRRSHAETAIKIIRRQKNTEKENTEKAPAIFFISFVCLRQACVEPAGGRCRIGYP